MEGGVNFSMETNAFHLMFKRGLGGSSDNEVMVIGFCRSTLLSRGFAKTSKHRDYEERSHYYDALLAAESRAKKANKGMHSQKESPVMHITDLTTVSVKKAKDFLPFLQRPSTQTNNPYGDLQSFKLTIAMETCSIAFSLSGVRCPKGEPYSDEAIALMRRRIYNVIANMVTANMVTFTFVAASPTNRTWMISTQELASRSSSTYSTQ